MKINRIDSYLDGGSVSVLLTNMDPLFIESLELPDTPKYGKGDSSLTTTYEVWRDFKIDKTNNGKYYWGDINKECVELPEDHPLIQRLKEMIVRKRESRTYII